MYDTLLRLYDKGNGKLTKDMLKKAVNEPLKWINADQYKVITGEDYTA